MQILAACTTNVWCKESYNMTCSMETSIWPISFTVLMVEVLILSDSQSTQNYAKIIKIDFFIDKI